ncbi:MAG: hypothetical protein SWH68_00305, partial [Thermodesulfobacteriota bacterium]|nr:hypothetical protein [Thermodesulfobacteriota bacterium]
YHEEHEGHEDRCIALPRNTPVSVLIIGTFDIRICFEFLISRFAPYRHSLLSLIWPIGPGFID